MVAVHRKWLGICFVVVVVVALLIGFVWPLVSIQLRLPRNGAIAHQLVDSLHVRYPGTGFRGVASYESEVVYIRVVGRLDEAKRQDVERWLRRQKAERQIAPVISLRFENDFEKEIVIR
jgi:hypothetical protein